MTVMKNYDESFEIKHWPSVPNHPYRILIIGCSWSGKANVLLSLIKHQRPDIEKIFESRYQLLINGRKKVENENFGNPKPLINRSQTIDDVYESLENYNPTKKQKVLIVFHDMIADMESNKTLSPKVT